MNRVDTFHRYSQVARLIKQQFGHLGAALYEGESRDEFSLHIREVNLTWLIGPFLNLTETLFDADFKIKVSLQVHSVAATISIERVDGNNLIVWPEPDVRCIEDVTTSLPSEAVEIFGKLETSIRSGASVEFNVLTALLRELNSMGVRFAIGMDFYLNKIPINDALRRDTTVPKTSRVFSFLFPEGLLQILGKSSISELEGMLFEEGIRTVLVVFGMEGLLRGDSLSVCGLCPEEDLISCLTDDPDPTKGMRVTESLRFRNSICNWQATSSQLLPDIFEVVRDEAVDSAQCKMIHEELTLFQGLLAILSMASRVSEDETGCYHVEFRGYRLVMFEVDKAKVREKLSHVEDLFDLYRWAYEGWSGDKVEITRNIVSLSADSLDGFMQNASDIYKSARSSYQFYLKRNIDAYFETRRKIREAIEKFADDTAGETLRLTKETSENVFKTAGLVAAVVVAAIVKPESTYLAGFIGSLVIAVFLCIVLFYHLQTIRRAVLNRKLQYNDYISSYSESLDEHEIADFLRNETLEKQQEFFKRRHSIAQWIYRSLLLISVIFAIIFGVLQFSTGPG